MIKPIAFYLPQFHEIEENNRWWGKGFTEWTSVKDAKPVFKGHIQPREPLNGYYYNLLDKDTMKWQAELAKKYRIYGFCMYHYYFKNGKKLLEKPAENLLKWKDIDIHFCFSWANESWIRTWSKLEGNDWNESRDKSMGEMDVDKDGILAEQDYGNIEQWRDHYEYLRPFFKDSRYIKIDNQPVFLIYKTEKIECLNEMLDCWEDLAQKDGFSGICILATNSIHDNSSKIKGTVKFEPKFSQNNGLRARAVCINYICSVFKMLFGSYLKKWDYDKVWKNILKSYHNSDGKIYPGAFTAYDDTPRRGKNGEIFKNATPEKFCRYLSQLCRQCKENYNQEYVFINAWNEWAEGAHLEPDTVDGYKWLEAVKRAVEENEEI